MKKKTQHPEFVKKYMASWLCILYEFEILRTEATLHLFSD